jgi:hypothetical protein
VFDVRTEGRFHRLGPALYRRLSRRQRPRLKDLLNEERFERPDHRRVAHHFQRGGADKRWDGPNLDPPATGERNRRVATDRAQLGRRGQAWHAGSSARVFEVMAVKIP